VCCAFYTLANTRCQGFLAGLQQGDEWLKESLGAGDERMWAIGWLRNAESRGSLKSVGRLGSLRNYCAGYFFLAFFFVAAASSATVLL
jgi:hypothetical protein